MTTLEAGVWVETVTEGGRRFMAAWKKEDVDAARHARRRERERDWETCYRTAAHATCEATPIGLVDESKPVRARDLRSAYACRYATLCPSVLFVLFVSYATVFY